MPRPSFAPARRTAAFVLALAAAPAMLGAQRTFTSLTVFGDSYVDTGNAFALSGGTQAAPPYVNRRFSNGAVFTDYLAQALGRPGDATAAFTSVPVPGVTPLPASGNFAIGGARTDNAQGTAVQLNLYLNRPGTTPATRTDPTGLYTLFVGGNDLRDAGGLSAPLAQAAGVTAAQNVITQAGALAGAGARNILLFTLQSPGVLPEALGSPSQAASRNAATAAFNATLAAGIAGLQAAAPGATFFNFRLDNLFANLLADAQTGGTRYGLTNVTTPCLTGFAPPGAPSCDVSVFADGIHPTTRTHAVVGDALARYVTTGQNVALVPEPSTFALAAGGLAALGAAAARRRRAA